MQDVFTFKTRSGRTIGDIVFAPADRLGITFTVVDVGARNGMFLLPASYTQRAHLIGFEPNPEEYAKLIANKTDAMALGAVMPRFRKVTYHPCALWHEDGQVQFHVTRGVGASTLMGATNRAITEKICFDQTQTLESAHTEVTRTFSVDGRRLDGLLAKDETVDFLKIDTEGSELFVLQGASDLFSRGRALFIKSEFITTPYFAQSKLLCHQHLYLHERGMRLADLDFDHPRYSRGTTRIPAFADRKMFYAGDAYFIKDPDVNTLDDQQRYRLGVTSIALGFRSLGLNLLKETGYFSAKDLDEAESAMGRQSPQKWMKYWWGRLPSCLGYALSRMRQACLSVRRRA